MELATTTRVVADDMPWQPEGVSFKDWSDKEVMTLKSALPNRRLHGGFVPPVAQRGLVDILEDIDKSYLAHMLGGSLCDTALKIEHMEVADKYQAKQAKIVSIPVIHTASTVLPLPGIVFTPSIPTTRSGSATRHGRGDPPISVIGVLPRPLGCYIP